MDDLQITGRKRRKEAVMRWLSIPIVLLVIIVSMIAPVAAAGPELSVVAPKDGEAIAGTEVTVRFTTRNIKLVPTSVPVSEAGKRPDANRPGEGHVHFVLDLQPLVVWERGDPYTFTNVPPGEHQLMVELANNDHSSLSPRVMQIVRFGTGSPKTLPITGRGAYASAVPVLLVLGLLMLAAGVLILRRQLD
jgi:hypothetical protein